MSVRLGVVGCGHWGPNHIRNFNSLEDASVLVTVDRDPARLDRITTMFPEVRPETDVDQVLRDPSIDALVIATPTSSHYSLVRAALLAGKHVLCEKPLCESSSDGEELLAIAQDHRLILMVGHVFLFNPAVVKMKEIISSGGLGSMRYVSSVRTNLGPIRNDVNAAYDLASHDVSIINWLVDDMPVLASATGAAFLQKDIHDVVFISLRYPGGVMANVQASWLNPKKVRQMTVVGSQRMMTWDDIELSSPVAVYDKGADATQEYSDYGEFLRVAMWDGDVRLPKVHLDEPLKLQDRHFIEAIQGKAVERSGGAFGLGVVRVLEAIAGSLALDGRPVEVRRCPSSPGLDQAWREQFRTEMQAVNLDTRVR